MVPFQQCLRDPGGSHLVVPSSQNTASNVSAAGEEESWGSVRSSVPLLGRDPCHFYSVNWLELVTWPCPTPREAGKDGEPMDIWQASLSLSQPSPPLPTLPGRTKPCAGLACLRKPSPSSWACPEGCPAWVYGQTAVSFDCKHIAIYPHDQH